MNDDTIQPLWQQHMNMNRCIHFTGLSRGRCRVGVEYRSVETPGRWPVAVPCLRDRSSEIVCERAHFPTEEEAKAHEAEVDAMIQAYLDKLARDICPYCDQPITKRQIGCCVYAEPCGHRLYQGTA